MVDEKYNNYLVEGIRRINIRYYLVRISGRYYIVDYVNPRRLTSYFLAFSQDREWTIYDVTEDRERYGKENMWFLKLINQLIIIIFLLLLVQMVITPRRFNLEYLTYASHIKEHWLMEAGFVVAGAAIITLILYILPHSLNLEDKKSYKLRLSKGRKKEYPLLLRFLFSLLFFGLLTTLGIGNSSYIGLFLFAYLANYSLYFTNFIEFQLTQAKRKYKMYSER